MGLSRGHGTLKEMARGHGLNSSDLSYALHVLGVSRFKRVSDLSRTEARVEDCRSDSFALPNFRPDLNPRERMPRPLIKWPVWWVATRLENPSIAAGLVPTPPCSPGCPPLPKFSRCTPTLGSERWERRCELSGKRSPLSWLHLTGRRMTSGMSLRKDSLAHPARCFPCSPVSQLLQ